jgi:hypothetical protein
VAEVEVIAFASLRRRSLSSEGSPVGGLRLSRSIAASVLSRGCVGGDGSTIRLLLRRIAKLLLDERMKNGRLLGTLLTHLVGEPQPIISEAHQAHPS